MFLMQVRKPWDGVSRNESQLGPHWGRELGSVQGPLFYGHGVPVRARRAVAPYLQHRMESIRLEVPFESQLDNASGFGSRECFSSSCAMLARFWGRVRSDDQYNQIRSGFGDTTCVQSQIQALRYLGLKSHFWTNGRREDLLRELRGGRPVAVGWLHKGHVSRPLGSGHWSVIVGTWAQGYLMHDPFGEALLVSGGYTRNTMGAYLRYSYKNWEPRWLIEGPRTGWYLTCSA